MKIFKIAVLGLFFLSAVAFATDKVNINTAGADELSRVLVGIGPAKARAIVEYREENGPFKSMDQLALVKGIGLQTVELNRELIVVDASEGSAKKQEGMNRAAPVSLPRR